MSWFKSRYRLFETGLVVLGCLGCTLITSPDYSKIEAEEEPEKPSKPSKPSTSGDGGAAADDETAVEDETAAGDDTAPADDASDDVTADDTGAADDTTAVADDETTPDDFDGYTEWPFNSKEAQRRQQETADELGLPVEKSIDLGNDVKMVFMLVPAGKSELGSPDDTPGFEADEALRMVTIRKPFYIGKYQVRRDEYAALMGKEAENDPFSFVRMTDSPAEPALAKYEAVRDELLPLMQEKLPKNWTVRLPTEDEWEHATRAGTATLWYSGDTEADLAEIGWYGANAMDTLQPVGQLKPNAWGLYDMVGNAWHYVFRKDGWYNDTDKEAHIVRGGDCQSPAFGNGCRTSNYMISSVTAGYRFALDPP